MVAACNGHTDVITYLLDNGADVNAVNQVSVSVLVGGNVGVCVYVSVVVWERDSMCVCGREQVCLCVCVRELVCAGGRECVCLC